MAHGAPRLPAGAGDGRALGRAARRGGAPQAMSEAAGTRGPRLTNPDTFLSGEHGEVGGKRGLLRRAADAALDRRLRASGALRKIDAAASRLPRRDVLVASIYRPPADRLQQALPRLQSDRHTVEQRLGSIDDLRGGKFENLNTLLEQ